MYNPGGEYLAYIHDGTIRKPRSKIEVDGKTYTGLEHLVSFPKIIHETEKMIGGFPAKTCEFEIYNLDGSLDLNGKEVQVYRGLDVSETKTVWIPMGLFYADGDDVTNNSTKRSIKFKGTDRTRLFDSLFTKTWANGIIPVGNTLSNLATKICATCGVSLDTTTKKNILSYQTTEEIGVPENTTNRQVIAWIAELSGCIPIISRDGQSLVFTRPTTTQWRYEAGATYHSGYYIDRSEYKTLSVEPKYGSINAVSFGHNDYDDAYVYQDDTDVEANGLHEWQINDNALAENQKVELAPLVLAKLKGMKIYPFNLTECIDDYLFDINDGICIKKKDGNHVSTNILGMSTSSRIRSTLKAGVQDSSTADRNLAGSVKTDLKSVKLSVDHINKQITALVKESDSKYSELQQTVNGFDAKIVDTENNLKAEIKATAESIEATYAKTETVKGQIDGVTNQISSLSSQISDIDDQLTGLDETIADKVSTEVTKETTIEVLAGKVESNISGNYVTKSSYEDDKENWVLKTDYNSQIKQTDQSIAAAVSRVSVLEAAGYITEATCNSLIDAQADKITLAVEGNLKIGARNILLDSACFKSAIRYDQYLATASTVFHGTDSRTPSGEFKRIAMKKSSSYSFGGVMFKQEDILGQKENGITKIKANTTYTLSFWAKAANGTSTFSLTKYSRFPVYTATPVTYDKSRCNYVKDSNGYIALSNTEWRRIVLVFTTSAEYNETKNAFCLWFATESTSQVSLEISSLKLEEGNIATDWTPSTEDIEDSVQAKIDLCVQKDENNNLVSEINISSDLLTINTDNFTLDKKGNMTCASAQITGGVITCGDSSYSMTIAAGAIVHKFSGEEIGQISPAMLTEGTELIAIENIYGKNGVQIGSDTNRILVNENGVLMGSDTNYTTLGDDGFLIETKIGTSTELLKICHTDDWYYGQLSAASRKLIQSNSALIVSANNANNALLLEGSAVWLCGKVRMANYYNNSTGKVPLYVNLSTGEITT